MERIVTRRQCSSRSRRLTASRMATTNRNHRNGTLAVRKVDIRVRVIPLLVMGLFLGGGNTGVFALAVGGRTTRATQWTGDSFLREKQLLSINNHRGCLPSTKAGGPRTITRTTQLRATPPSFGSEEQSLLFWITAFSSSHIGMSAIRQTLIEDVFGKFLARDVLDIVGKGKLALPDFWPGDSSGTNELFPDVETTGRQFYRIFYTMVSFLTLGTAFSIYLGLQSTHRSIISETDLLPGDGEVSFIILGYLVSSLSLAFSLASLVNASPLGLMPSFRRSDDADADAETAASVPGGTPLATTTTTTTAAAAAAGDTLLGITRDDTLKYDPKGLTRITRHPLILPVFPWGIATAVLVGGKPSDFVFFGGLSLYAVAGCYCQDLRVLREEGSVGTVFFGSGDDETINNGNSVSASVAAAAVSARTIQGKLRTFYDETSFLPFRALMDGRQSWESMIQEFPVGLFLVAIPVSFAIETAFLRFLGIAYSLP